MEAQKILVTGGTGYIGSHTCVELIEQGFEVIIIDNLVNSTIDSIDGIASITGVRPDFYNIDLQNAKALDVFFEKNKAIKAIIHFAALKAVGESVEQPIRYYQNNLFGLINLIRLMQKYKVNDLLFSSSATVYGVPDSLPLTENHATQRALSPYGNTKKIVEEILEDVTKADQSFNAISLRYFNPIGAHETAKIGELPNGIPNNLMPFITQTAAGLRKELLIFGDDYNTVDGTAVRDYIHVVDLAEAHVKAMQRLLSKKQKVQFEIFNLGTGKGSSVLEVIQSFEKMSGQKLPYRFVDRRAGDVEQMYASTELANQELNWKAKYNLDDMTASSWKWEQHARGLNK